MLDVLEAQERARSALIPALDIVETRVTNDDAPSWCESRGWSSFLLELGDEEVARSEREGLARSIESLPGAPESLILLARTTASASRVPTLAFIGSNGQSDRGVPLRKQWQLEPLLNAIAPMAEAASRIVDVGTGHGHLARIAATRFARATVGLDRDEARLETAVSLAGEATGARFVAFDAAREEIPLDAGDLALGLHACGELGDKLVLAAARAQCDIALVSCCFQKVRGESRSPLSRAGLGLTLKRQALGLANVTARSTGVETSMDEIMEARRVRHALHHLLRSRGEDLLAGAEMRGINRRAAHAGLAVIAARALAIRGLSPASDAEIRACEAEAGERFARIRRLSLPRAMLARLVEVALVLDRAALLCEAGHTVVVATVFDDAASPRNLGLFASRTPERLSALVTRAAHATHGIHGSQISESDPRSPD